MTEEMRLQIQAAEMGFLRRLAGASLGNRVKSSVIHEGLKVELLLLCIESSLLRLLGYFVRIPPVGIHRGRYSSRIKLVEGHGADRGLDGQTISLRCPGNASGSLSRTWLMCPGNM